MKDLGTTMRRVLATGVLALAMTVGLASAGVSTAVTSSSTTTERAVVGKSDLGKIKSKVYGRTSEGDRVRGSFTPIKVVKRDGALHVKGFLRGVILDKGPNTRFSGIKTIPIKKVNGEALSARSTSGRAAAAQCEVLNLVLGPLDLNLLGLEISLNRVVLDITAVPGAGNLLGNLLCAVAGLLDGGPLAGLLGQLRTLLNQILGALNLGI